MMKTPEGMWTHEESIETAAPAAKIWELFSDVAGWKKWNAGIQRIEIDGPFAKGTSFSMQLPGGETFASTLIDVRRNEGFTDETVIGETRVVVYHEILPLAPGRTRVTYRTVITGPTAAEFGPMVTADFPAVLAALKDLAEKT